MSIVKEKKEDIIRGLDVLNIGPYLVRNGVLSQKKYTEEFSSLIEDGRAVNDELTPKLFEVILDKPSQFCKALDECVKETHHEGHQELVILLQQNVVRCLKPIIIDHRGAHSPHLYSLCDHQLTVIRSVSQL